MTPIIQKTAYPWKTKLCLPTQKGFTIVKLEEIVFCEAQRSYTSFHLLDKRPLLISRPLFDYDRILTNVFLRIHKSFLINIMHVKEYLRGEGGAVVMSNGVRIDISRRKKEEFLAAMKASFKY